MNIAFAANIFYLFLFYANCKFVFLKIFSFFPEEKTKHNLNSEESFQLKKKKAKYTQQVKTNKQKKHQKALVAKLFIKNKLEIRSLPWGNVTYTMTAGSSSNVGCKTLTRYL